MHICQPNICEKIKNLYTCKLCDYSCSKKFLFTQHLQTLKHKKNDKQHLATPKYAPEKYKCDNCNKIYRQRSGLWRHKKKCVKNDITDTNELKEVMKTIIANFNNNNEIKNELLDQLKVQSNIIKDIIPKIGNNNNNRFNINVFLNEKCKNAVNMTDFIELAISRNKKVC